MAHKLFIWNNAHNGDIASTVPLIWEVYNQVTDVEIIVGAYINQAYLYEGTPVKDIIVYPNYDRDGISDNFSSICPEGYANIFAWLGQYEDTQDHTWENQIKVFNRKCVEARVPIFLVSNNVPGIRVPYKKLSVPMHKNMIWIESGPCRAPHSYFTFNMDKLSKTFPDYYFYVNSKPNVEAENVIDCSHLNLIELSNLSNKCDVILGKGSGPYMFTFTDANRYKPRAVMGRDLTKYSHFWPYKGNSVHYLYSEDALIKYLKKLDL